MQKSSGAASHLKRLLYTQFFDCISNACVEVVMVYLLCTVQETISMKR